jgi:hypothetical protein
MIQEIWSSPLDNKGIFMRRILSIILLLELISLACKTSGQGPEKISESVARGEQVTIVQEGFQADFGAGPADLGTLDMSLGALGSFAARFEFKFEGSTNWLYQVDTRYDGKRTEYTLHIEGVDNTLNPGDVRLVNVNGINRMRGAGTEDICLQFPDEMETGLLFLTPVDFIDLEEFSTEWKQQGNQTVADLPTTLHQAEREAYRGWEEVKVEYAVEEESQAILVFYFEASGPDPLFGYGYGKITGLFTVLQIGYQEINQVGGCKSDVPLPDDATDIIFLPGVSSYQTSLGPVKLSKFYEDQLLTKGWVLNSSSINDQTLEGWLVYSKNALQITVHIEPNNPEDFSQGFLIKIYEEGQE